MFVQEITGETIVAELVQAGVPHEGVKVNSLSPEEKVLNLDFNDVFFSQLNSTGTAGEQMLIGSVVNTFLNAYGMEFVVLTVNGNIPESGHAVYDQPIGFMD